MAQPTNERVRTRAQRVASRVNYDGFPRKVVKHIRADEGFPKIALILVAVFLICTICGVWDPPSKFRRFMTPDRNIVCNAPFKMQSADLTNAERKSARLKTLRYYVNDPKILENYEGELVNGVQLLLEAPDFARCSSESYTFLRGFVKLNTSEDATQQAFDKIRSFLAEDAQLAHFRKTLETALQTYREHGVLLKLRSWDANAAEQSSLNAADSQDSAPAAVKKAQEEDEYVNKIVRIKVYDAGEDPAKAREENVSDVLFGNGYVVKRKLEEIVGDREFAYLLTNKIRSSIPETLTIDYPETQRAQDATEREVETRYLSFYRGDPLVEAGTSLGPEELRLLDAERRARLAERTWRERTTRFVSTYALLSLLFVGAFLLFHNHLIVTDVTRRKRRISEVVVFLALIVGFIGVGRILQVALHNGSASPEIIPILVFVGVVALAASWEVALTFGVLLSFVLTTSGQGGIDTFVVFVGVGALLAIATPHVRTRMHQFILALATSGAAFVLTLVAGGIAADHTRVLIEASARGLWVFLAGIISVGVLPVFEKFGVMTTMSLNEWCNLSQPLLLELNRRAPGTYSHSIQTAALAEAAAETIGAHSTLVRVAGYYHDVGKMLQPDNFTENQQGTNIHDGLEPRMSVLIIVAHTKDGVDLARRYKLPNAVIELIEQHHGTMTVGGFYKKAAEAVKAKDPDAPPLDDAPFRYPGPRPQSKEAAILMLADAVESASHSISDFSRRRVESLAQKIVDIRIKDAQFDDSGLTFGEIHAIEQSLISNLLASRHTRVKYEATATAEELAAKGAKSDQSESRFVLPPKETPKDGSSEKGRAFGDEFGFGAGGDTSVFLRRPSCFEDATQK